MGVGGRHFLCFTGSFFCWRWKPCTRECDVGDVSTNLRSLNLFYGRRHAHSLNAEVIPVTVADCRRVFRVRGLSTSRTLYLHVYTARKRRAMEGKRKGKGVGKRDDEVELGSGTPHAKAYTENPCAVKTRDQ